MAELLFHGATHEVTGSMHMLQVNNRWVALDCGLYQGRRAESEAKNREWPLPAKDIDAVVLSHAHIDHSGRLPKLAQDGFEGAIHCTPATRDLCAIMLPDSAHIQQEDVQYVNKKRRRKGLGPVEPLYDYRDAVAAIELMETRPYGRWFPVVPGLRARYVEAGHMLGSAGVWLEVSESGAKKYVYFTGDIGRPEKPILRDPAPLPECDALICESTYGGRVNERVWDAKEQFRDIVKRTVDRDGKVIVPAFAVGRTQTVVYFLHEMMVSGELPRIPIFVDSPLAVNATEVFKMHPECYDSEARAFHRKTGDILGGDCCTYIQDVEESKALHPRQEPCVIISASGMCEAGRIRHHIKNNIRARKNTILIVGWQAAHTLGRRLVDGAEEINLFHDTYEVRADIEQIHGFSGHADRSDLLNMLRPLAGKVRQTFLVHGEEDQAQALQTELDKLPFGSVHIPERGVTATV